MFALWGGVSGVSGHETFGGVGLFITIGLTFQGQTETMVKIMLKIVEW